MRKTLTLAALTATALAVLAAPAQAAAPRSSQLACFNDGSPGVCTSLGGGAYELDTNDAAGAYAGVYLLNKSMARKSFAKLTSLGFSYDGDVSGGSPRLSIQIIHTDGRDGWVFIDAATCNDGNGNVAPLTDTSCAVSGYYWNSDNTTTPFSYPAYADFLAGEAGSLVGKAIPFVIADAPGEVTVSAIKLGNSK